MAKIAFSRSDVAAITGRLANKEVVVVKDGRYNSPDRDANNVATSAMVSRAPSSPVAAKVLREVGVSSEKISDAYRVALARTTTVKPK